MFIIIHNKLINKCYFGTFGKHSVFGNGDVSNRKPNLRNCVRSASRVQARNMSAVFIAFRLPRCAVLRRRHRSPHWRLLGHGYFTVPARTNSFVPESFLLDRYFCTQVSHLYEFF